MKNVTMPEQTANEINNAKSEIHLHLLPSELIKAVECLMSSGGGILAVKMLRQVGYSMEEALNIFREMFPQKEAQDERIENVLRMAIYEIKAQYAMRFPDSDFAMVGEKNETVIALRKLLEDISD